ITLVGLVDRLFEAEGYLAFPLDVIGSNYVVAGYHNGSFLPGSQFAIVGTQNGTTVTVTPANPFGSHAAGVPYTVVLNQGQVYEAEDMVNGLGHDLTGTTVVSTRPVAVFGGHKCADVPSSASACDNLVEE